MPKILFKTQNENRKKKKKSFADPRGTYMYVYIRLLVCAYNFFLAVTNFCFDQRIKEVGM